jgi:hypothetical protein
VGDRDPDRDAIVEEIRQLRHPEAR